MNKFDAFESGLGKFGGIMKQLPREELPEFHMRLGEYGFAISEDFHTSLALRIFEDLSNIMPEPFEVDVGYPEPIIVDYVLLSDVQKIIDRYSGLYDFKHNPKTDAPIAKALGEA